MMYYYKYYSTVMGKIFTKLTLYSNITILHDVKINAIQNLLILSVLVFM